MGIATVIGLCMAILALIGSMFCVISYEWKRSSALASQQSLRGIYHAEGLWLRCSVPTAGIMHCDNYSTTLFDVAVHLQILRAFAIFSSMLLFVSCAMDTLALDCINCVKPRMQMWLARGGGICAILGGVLCLAAVSWYAAEIIRDFRYDLDEDGMKYTFGSALYVGWIAGGLAVISGAVTTCCACSSEEDEGPSYEYKPPKSRTNEEYV